MNLYRFIFPLLLFVFATQTSFAQQSGYATMRVFDCNKGVGMGVGYLQSKIIIAYENGTLEEIELLPFGEKTEPENLKRITETLNKMKTKGYFLIAQSTTGEQGSLITDYTFMKQ
ncbi:MAG: hypothetical protein KIS94_03010 [Chitinophagales bacterium]|nr:hypothetical protein [Chitinophagales bacterium]